MILGTDGKRLSKRHGATSVTEYRDMGYLPQAVANYLVRLGWSHGDQEIFTLRGAGEVLRLGPGGRHGRGLQPGQDGLGEPPVAAPALRRRPGAGRPPLLPTGGPAGGRRPEAPARHEAAPRAGQDLPGGGDPGAVLLRAHRARPEGQDEVPDPGREADPPGAPRRRGGPAGHGDRRRWRSSSTSWRRPAGSGSARSPSRRGWRSPAARPRRASTTWSRSWGARSRSSGSTRPSRGFRSASGHRPRAAFPPPMIEPFRPAPLLAGPDAQTIFANLWRPRPGPAGGAGALGAPGRRLPRPRPDDRPAARGAAGGALPRAGGLLHRPLRPRPGPGAGGAGGGLAGAQLPDLRRRAEPARPQLPLRRDGRPGPGGGAAGGGAPRAAAPGGRLLARRQRGGEVPGRARRRAAGAAPGRRGHLGPLRSRRLEPPPRRAGAAHGDLPGAVPAPAPGEGGLEGGGPPGHLRRRRRGAGHDLRRVRRAHDGAAPRLRLATTTTTPAPPRPSSSQGCAARSSPSRPRTTRWCRPSPCRWPWRPGTRRSASWSRPTAATPPSWTACRSGPGSGRSGWRPAFLAGLVG